MVWQETPFTVPLAAAGIVSALLGVRIWRFRQAPGTRTGAVLLLATAEWTLGYALELGSADLAGKLFWSKLEYLGVVSVPVALFAFALRYTGRDQWITVRTRLLLSLVPLITLLLVTTNELHGLIWSSVALDGSGSFAVLAVVHGSWFWIFTLYSYSLVMAATLMFLQMLLRSGALYRWQASAIVTGCLIPWAANALYLSRVTPPPRVDLTPAGFTVGALVLAWTLSRLRRGDIVSVSRGTIIESMGDGVVVLDAENRVVDLNPAAESHVGKPVATALGRPLEEVWPEWAARRQGWDGGLPAVQEMVLGEGDGQRPLTCGYPR